MDSFKVPTTVEKDNNLKKTKPSVELSNESDDKSKAQPSAVCPYVEPKWSKAPLDDDGPYKFEVLKNGVILDDIKNLQDKAYHVFGRLPSNDFVMLHPTISRFHAVLQYRPETVAPTTLVKDLLSEGFEDPSEEQASDICSKKKIDKGWYLYDLNSTHGTFLNKMKIPSKTYIRVHIGHMIKLGASSRIYILHGPDNAAQVENSLTITEVKMQRLEMEKAKQEKLAAEREIARLQKEKEDNDGISWGMGEDADEESDLSINPYASTNNEELFLDDPKKTLRGYFEREGLEMYYKLDEISPGSFVCKIELPLDDAFGRPLIAEAAHKGKKKDCVVQCALEACRILDRHGVLRQANQEPMRKRKDHSDSDDDDFLDRTGDIERKRMKKLQQNQEKVVNYEELLQQESDIKIKIAEIEENINKYHENEKTKKMDETSGSEDLDDFMSNLSTSKQMDKTDIKKLRVEQNRLKDEYTQLQKLIKIARPVELPPLTVGNVTESSTKDSKKVLPLFGKRDKCRFSFTSKKSVVHVVPKSINTTDSNTDVTNVESIDVENTKPEEDISVGPNADILENTNSIEDGGDTQIDSLQNATIEIPKVDTMQPPLADKTSTAQDAESNSKKKRSRARIRGKYRDNVDMDDAEEVNDEEKFSKWVPPVGQTGDGFTALNDKYGY